MRVACIVEGHGDEAGVPILIRRLAPEAEVSKPVRVPRGKLTNEGELHRAVVLAHSKAGGSGAHTLIVFDADDDCPVDVADAVREMAASRLGVDETVSVVVANREFEAWFLAGAESLVGQRGLLPELEPPEDPDGVRNAKGWLTERMTGSRAYKETVDQPALAALVDIALARGRSRSFDKFCREVEHLSSLAQREGES